MDAPDCIYFFRISSCPWWKRRRIPEQQYGPWGGERDPAPMEETMALIIRTPSASSPSNRCTHGDNCDCNRHQVYSFRNDPVGNTRSAAAATETGTEWQRNPRSPGDVTAPPLRRRWSGIPAPRHPTGQETGAGHGAVRGYPATGWKNPGAARGEATGNGRQAG